MNLSDVFKNVEESQTLKISAKAKEMIKEGIDVINLAVGEPDFDTPDYIKNFAKKAIDENKTRYTDASGIVELREAIAEKLKKENGINAKKENIVVTNGAKEAIFLSLFSILNPDDEVMVILPYFTSYTEVIKLCRAKPVLIEKNNGKITKEELENKKTDKTKLIMICSPNNPDGHVIDEDEFKAIKDFAIKNNVFILSDEIYENIIFDDNKNKSFASDEELFKKGLVITINGMSKAFSMTGWRVGYVHARDEIIKNIKVAKGHISSNTSSISQYAALEALKGFRENIEIFENNTEEFKKRRDVLVSILKDDKNISLKSPSGSFYAFIDISKILNRKYKDRTIKSDLDICEILLKDFNLSITPGLAFGDGNFVRLSFAADIKKIEKAANIIKEFSEKIV
ncbi:MAG: pyridoxal phosphate-dependent aminotransferase [Peptoniphilaceae bacterium]|nr:pyridoxal phosphate-dependent aminotransferase [Peptoniphilaceae bacterium]MDY3737527.1 pyridoxal phosphate-dependent aminotransferase [Peptoniphilaceae bacterium]